MVALITFGEGWHNNHHAHPTSARHGLAWYEVDLNWYTVWVLKKLRLARQVYCVLLQPQVHAMLSGDAQRTRNAS